MTQKERKGCSKTGEKEFIYYLFLALYNSKDCVVFTSVVGFCPSSIAIEFQKKEVLSVRSTTITCEWYRQWKCPEAEWTSDTQKQKHTHQTRLQLAEVWWMRREANDYRILRMKNTSFFVHFFVFFFIYFFRPFICSFSQVSYNFFSEI